MRANHRRKTTKGKKKRTTSCYSGCWTLINCTCGFCIQIQKYLIPLSPSPSLSSVLSVFPFFLPLSSLSPLLSPLLSLSFYMYIIPLISFSLSLNLSPCVYRTPLSLCVSLTLSPSLSLSLTLCLSSPLSVSLCLVYSPIPPPPSFFQSILPHTSLPCPLYLIVYIWFCLFDVSLISPFSLFLSLRSLLWYIYLMFYCFSPYSIVWSCTLNSVFSFPH